MTEQGLLSLHPVGLMSLLPRRNRRGVRRPAEPAAPARPPGKRSPFANAVHGVTRGNFRVRSVFPFTITRK